MSDPQQFGLGELGQRVQAMSDPAAPPRTGSPESAPADPRLRPYQGAPLPTGSLTGRGPIPSFEQRPDLSADPRASQTAATPARPPEPALKTAPASSWEQVSVPSKPAPTSELPSAATDAPESPAAQSTSQAAANVPAAGDTPRSGFQRAFDALRSAIPVVQKLLPLIDGNFATAMSALMAPQQHPAPPPPVPVDLEPVERGLAEVRTSNRELRAQVLEQSTTLKRVEDQLDRVREATDRNTLEQQELVEDLRAVGSRISTFAIIGVILLLISLGLNGYLIYQLQHILR